MADVWFITGAGRGMGVDIAQAAVAAGHAVVATGRNTDTVAEAVGEADDLLVVDLDITSLELQTNDPAKLANALLRVVAQEHPPLRWVAGADAVAAVEGKANELLAQVDAYRELSSSLAVDEPTPSP
jgi:NAD(P)-dependent dehydrogenase (short-subunit alcohol dehydrogenase family)